MHITFRPHYWVKFVKETYLLADGKKYLVKSCDGLKLDEEHLWARIAAVFANKADAKTLNRATGIVLVVLGIVVMGFNLLTK